MRENHLTARPLALLRRGFVPIAQASLRSSRRRWPCSSWPARTTSTSTRPSRRIERSSAERRRWPLRYWLEWASACARIARSDHGVVADVLVLETAILRSPPPVSAYGHRASCPGMQYPLRCLLYMQRVMCDTGYQRGKFISFVEYTTERGVLRGPQDGYRSTKWSMRPKADCQRPWSGQDFDREVQVLHDPIASPGASKHLKAPLISTHRDCAATFDPLPQIHSHPALRDPPDPC